LEDYRPPRSPINRRQEIEEGTFRREELPGKFMAKKLFGWSGKRYEEY